MDKDTAGLIAELCTRIGMIMEDASLAALTISGMNDQDRKTALAAIELAAARLSALIAAAKALDQ